MFPPQKDTPSFLLAHTKEGGRWRAAAASSFSRARTHLEGITPTLHDRLFLRRIKRLPAGMAPDDGLELGALDPIKQKTLVEFLAHPGHGQELVDGDLFLQEVRDAAED